MCQSCHGEQGDGTYEIIADNWNMGTLTTKIHDTMPQGNVSACQNECATAIAEYILSWQTGVSCETPEELLPRRLRLLTPREYQLTTNDIFKRGWWNNYARDLPVTETIRGYDNNVPEIFISNAHVTQYWTAAETIVESVNLDNLHTCSSSDSNACATEWVSTLGKQLFRRPLTEQELQQYRDLYTAQSDSSSGRKTALKALLMSPNFIYRSELGEPAGNGQYRLTQYEVASLLSYTYWGTTPDETLLNAADAGELSSSDQIRQQVNRLLRSERAKDQFVHFAKQWLGTKDVRYIAKSNALFPNFNAQVSTAMDDEQIAFISNVFTQSDSLFKDLFLSDTLWINQALANFYGISGVTASEPTPTPSNAERHGILNLGAVLASHAKMDQTSPISRGVFVRERLLCQTFPAPPPNAGDVVPLDNSLSTRERFSAHTDNDGCRDCHEKIDPIGFSFERYDGSGHYRLEEAGNPIDDSGSITGMERMADTDYWPYQGTLGLSQLLAQSPHAASCFAEQYQTFVQGVAEPDGCGLHTLVQPWQANEYQLYDLWVQTALQPSFILRRGEVAQ